MADPELIASWERTTAHLHAARSALPAVSNEADRTFADYLDHNELGLAFEVLATVAEAEGAPPQCWAALARAADEMTLSSDDEAALLVRRHVG
ncbi:MAG TPA: hypothetical protein VFH54_14920 [Mycobacteriales bacterium]|nr:hypothetical protein [Mycobacteriales bacterium]